MCVAKVHRIITAMVLFLTIGIFIHNIVAGTIVLGFIGFMMLIWGLFDFCPMITILNKFLPQCECKENNNEQN